MNPIRVLSISSPGGDRGPAVGYRNHLKALSTDGFEMVEINQEIWGNDELLKFFDVAWAYVRFHPAVHDRLNSLGVPIIGGPNVALERGDVGITDDWERWYLKESKVNTNLNVAEYYTDRVKSFANSALRCRTLEYCYESKEIENLSKVEKSNDVLIYVKERVNDRDTEKTASLLRGSLDSLGISHRSIYYGSYSREDYLRECSLSRACAWLSIEDYCSLAQIESHLAGCCVVGTEYNLTIPVDSRAIVTGSQEMRDWISWKTPEEVSHGYTNAITRVLDIDRLGDVTSEAAKLRHSHDYYRKRTEEILKEIL
jgi:hypothetical protein